MKKILILSAVLIFGLSQVSFGQNLATSAHDFSDGAGLNLDAWNTSASNEMCGPCHVPHNADAVSVGAPLWSHDVSVAGFTPYVGTNMDAVDAGASPTGTSLLCLSCHDGTVDLDAHDQKAGTATDYKIVGSTLVGTDLSNDHPISITYNTALATADGGLHDPDGVGSSGLGTTITADMLFSGKMECASCHNAHNDANGSFLIKDNANSALCLTCHDK